MAEIAKLPSPPISTHSALSPGAPVFVPSLDLELGATTQAAETRTAATVPGTLAGTAVPAMPGHPSLPLATSASSLADVMPSQIATVTAAEGGVAAAAAKPVQ